MTLARYSKFMCCAVLFLIFMGANVTTHGAGLAVPDWPTSYGYNMFRFPVSYWIGGIFHEHVHRLVASLIGFLTIVLVIWTLRVEKRRWIRGLTLLALALVIAQGVLGGLTVKMMLPAWTSAMHGVLGQSFFCLLIAIAYFHSAEFQNRGVSHQSKLLRLACFLLGAVVVQLIVAVFLRHTESGLAVLDFPTMAGSWAPSVSADTVARINAERKTLGLIPVESYQVLLHLAHRGIALILAILGVTLVVQSRKIVPGKVRTSANLVAGAIFFQCILGIVIIFSRRLPIPTTFHVMFGALTLGLTLLLVLRAFHSTERS